jgi:hypothetical protein
MHRCSTSNANFSLRTFLLSFLHFMPGMQDMIEINAFYGKIEINDF